MKIQQDLIQQESFPYIVLEIINRSKIDMIYGDGSIVTDI